AMQALESSDRREYRARRELERVLASLQDAVLMVDEEARLRFLNAAATQFFKVRVQDVLGAQLLEILPSFELQSAVQEALREGRSSEREARLYAPRERHILLRVAPVRQEDGQVSGAVAILQDLTEMRRLEDVRREFVANASHELRTPIANIRAAAETILHSSDDPSLVSRFLPQMVAEAERLSRLVHDLLDLARAESSAPTPTVPVNLTDIAHDVVHQLQTKAVQQQVTVSCDFPNGSADGTYVMGEAAGLEQVVFNLLDNALSYTPPGGEVTLHLASPVGGTTEGAQKMVSLSVSDTGPGIPAADLPRIFERFYRVEKARSRAQGGTGLGLAIVKHIVENHHGHVQVESAVGQGTTFTVTLPAASENG
ncbi:MAG: ATP-binding protein, partial [Armatimonadota bacterium]|nr:ATP-binding protein [Armatimonadota bacterium]